MSGSVKVVGNIRNMQRATDKAMGEATELVVDLASREARSLASQSFHPPASRPGEPPAQRTQELSQSIKVIDVVKDKKGWLGIFGTTIDYGRFLELGTQDMAARPFLRPALDKTAKKAPDILRKAFGKSYRISGGLK